MNATQPSGKVARSSATRIRTSPLARVLRYENNAVVARIMQELKISESEAKALFQDTLKFLWLAGKFGGVVPSPASTRAGTRSSCSRWTTGSSATSTSVSSCTTGHGGPRTSPTAASSATARTRSSPNTSATSSRRTGTTSGSPRATASSPALRAATATVVVTAADPQRLLLFF